MFCAAACASAGSDALSSVLDQAANSVRSSARTPSSSQMTVIGSGAANDGSRSARSCPASPSSSSAVISSIRGRSRATVRPVNALLTSLRSREWSGGSVLSMWCPSASPKPPWVVAPAGSFASNSSCARRLSFCSRASASRARACAKSVTM